MRKESPMGMVDDTFGTNIFGANSTDKALGHQTRGANEANAFLKDIYGQQQQMSAPYSQYGKAALSDLASGDFAKNMEMDPGYQFRMQQGQNALNSSASARGALNSGATLKALQRYGQDFASNEYNNAYNRNYNRLSQLAGMGFNADQNLMNAAGNYGQQVSGNMTGMGNANAAANIAQANRSSDFLGQSAGAAAMYFSDARLKKNIVPLSKQNLDEMKKYLKAFAFNYTSDKFGKGDWVGVMAQDLEKSKLGKTLVTHDSEGNKQIDLKKVLSMFLATMAEA